MKTKEIFLKQFPNADTGIFEFDMLQVFFLYKRGRYPVYKDRIGGELKQYTNVIKTNMYLALGISDNKNKNDDKTIKFAKYRLNYLTQYKPYIWDSDPPKYKFWSTLDIYITSDYKTEFKFRDIFNESNLVFKTAKESQRWLNSPNLSYFSQALNCAVWCATAECGVTRDLVNDDQVGSFYKFHIYFTIRRILHDLQCPLPGDNQFSWNNNFYNKASYQSIQKEFNSNIQDYRFMSKYGNGLGFPYAWGYHGITKEETTTDYKPYHSSDQLPDEWAADGDQNSTKHDGHFKVAYQTH